jgi:hypothetical protein
VWTVRNPRFEVAEYDAGWVWTLYNDGEAVACSIGENNKRETILDFARWLADSNHPPILVIGGGVLEV